MTSFINQNKEYIIRIASAVVGALILWAFVLGGIIHDHNKMVLAFPSIQIEQQRLSMNDTLMSLKMEQIIAEQKLSRVLLNRIANKLHVEIPAQ